MLLIPLLSRRHTLFQQSPTKTLNLQTDSGYEPNSSHNASVAVLPPPLLCLASSPDTMDYISVYRARPLPSSLTKPMGVFVLPPSHRVSLAELDRADAQWRALREAAYARAWAEDATLVGSSRSMTGGSSHGENAARRRRRQLLRRLLRADVWWR